MLSGEDGRKRGNMAETGKGFFSQEGPFMKYGALVFDMVFISILWMFFSGIVLLFAILVFMPGLQLTAQWGLPILIVAVLLPVLHIGPATSACFFVMSRRQRDMDTYVWREFWKSYKRNYKQGIGLSAILNAVPGLLLWLIYTEIVYAGLFGTSVSILIGLQLIFVIEAAFLNIYCFSMLARFDMKTKEFIKIGFIMANKHLPTTLACLVLMVGSIAVTILYVPMLVAILPGVYSYATAALLEKVFRRYLPDEDEALEKEEVEGYDLDAERQAIIDRYTGNSHRYEDEEASITIVEEKTGKADITIVKHAEEEEQEK